MTETHTDETEQAGTALKRYPYSEPKSWPYWSCPGCLCKYFVRVDEQKPDRLLGPGQLIRCVNCKSVFDTRSEAAGAGTETREADGIYIASKTAHAARWRAMRVAGMPIVSTWIDEAGKGETACFADLWHRCVAEAKAAAAVVVYREPGEVLKGAWVEVGAALASGKPVFAVGIDEFSVRHHAGITICGSLEDALAAALAQPAPSPADAGLRARMAAALDGHTRWSRDCRLSGEYLCGLVWPLVEAALAQPTPSAAFGYLFHNPDTGVEWSASHPVESGECDDATDVRPATLEHLYDEMIGAWALLAEHEAQRARRDREKPTPAPAVDGVEALRALSEAATPGEASAPVWGTDFKIGGKLAGMMSPAGDGNGKADRAFIVAAVNFVRKAIATSTPAGAAGDPVGDCLTDDEMQAACEAAWTVARPIIARDLGGVDRGEWSDQSALVQTVTREELRAAFAAVSEVRATRLASQAPAASAGGDEPFPYQKTWNAIAAATTAFSGGAVTISVAKFREAFGPALAPTAQAQPAGREEIKHALAYVEDAARITLLDEGSGTKELRKQIKVLRDAILAARPVADEVAGEARDEEAEDLFQSERISAAQAVYDEAMADYDPTVPDHEVHAFDAMKAAIGCADAFGGPLA